MSVRMDLLSIVRVIYVQLRDQLVIYLDSITIQQQINVYVQVLHLILMEVNV
jgi:hypothetical protein